MTKVVSYLITNHFKTITNMVLAVQPQLIPTPKQPPSKHSGASANPACMTFYMAIQYNIHM